MSVNTRLVVRTWKRDGSTNIMDLDSAASNIAQNGRYIRSRRIGVGAGRAKSMLLSGETVSTNLAMFRLMATY